MSLDAFRAETRDWLEANCPDSMRQPYQSEKDMCWGGRKWTFASDDQRLWLERMAERGWTAPSWPREYGGGGLDRDHLTVLQEELARISARPPLVSFGVSMIGPAILEYGSEALKQQHLPPIVRGEIRWAQGYSEPNSGSDLASLQTRAEDRGDHWLVNGSKIWTSYGDLGDWMFCLVRTDFDTAKHGGISLVLFDMDSPGVTTRKIKLISGKSPFTETFFEDLRVDKNQVVGPVNGGWTVAKYLLTHEREMIADSTVLKTGVVPVGDTAIEALGTSDGTLNQAMLRAEIARFEIDEACLQRTLQRIHDETEAGASIGASSAMLKYYGTELNKRRFELLMKIQGLAGLDWEGEESQGGQLPRLWLRSKANSIEGGTSEIQLNIVAKRILGLPG